MARAPAELTAAELAVFRRRLDAPAKIQRFLDELPYNIEADGETFRSPRRVLADQTANCIEGAVLAAVALLGPASARRLTPLGPQLRAAGLLGHPTAGPARRG